MDRVCYRKYVYNHFFLRRVFAFTYTLPPESYYHLSERAADIWTIALAFLLWISFLRAYRLFQVLSLYVLDVVDRHLHARGFAAAEVQRTRVISVIREVVVRETAPERVCISILRDHVFVDRENGFGIWSHIKAAVTMHPVETLILVATSLMYLVITIGLFTISLLIVFIEGHDIGFSNGPLVGAWYPNINNRVDMANTSMFPPVFGFQTQMLSKAMAYAENYYNDDPIEEVCSTFYTKKIGYGERSNASCPFEDHMCTGGPNSAFDLDTWWLDSKILGINEKHTCEFRLRKVCSPLPTVGYITSMDEDFVGTRLVEYFYGDELGFKGIENKTWDEFVPDPMRQPRGPARYLIRYVYSSDFIHS